MFSARGRVLLSEHVSPTIRIRYDDANRPNTNRVFGPLFGRKANTDRILGTSLIISHYENHSNDSSHIKWSCQWKAGNRLLQMRLIQQIKNLLGGQLFPQRLTQTLLQCLMFQTLLSPNIRPTRRHSWTFFEKKNCIIIKHLFLHNSSVICNARTNDGIRKKLTDTFKSSLWNQPKKLMMNIRFLTCLPIWN